MAFMGTLLGMLAKVAYLNNQFAVMGFPSSSPIDAEMAIPMLLKMSLFPGLLGLLLATYFSAILSTADSCLMAASNSLISDICLKYQFIKSNRVLRFSQVATFVIGIIALILASYFENVLQLMLLSYGVMVSGLFIPVMAALYHKNVFPLQGSMAIIFGGGINLICQVLHVGDFSILWGLLASALAFYGTGTCQFILSFKENELDQDNHSP